MRRTCTIASLVLALGLLASCDQAVPTATPPCASATGGEWEFLGLQSDTLGRVREVVVDPFNPDRILVGTAQDFTGGLPAYLFLSEDHGATWQRVLTDIGTFKTILFHPDEPNVVYASPYGIYKSLDGGHTWARADDGINLDFGGRVQTMLFDPNDPGVLYAGTAGNGGSMLSLYRSTDGGASWIYLGQAGACPKDPTSANCAATAGVGAVAIDPRDSDRIYIAAWAASDVLVSEDRAENWAFTEYPGGGPNAIVLDEVDPSLLYVSGEGVAASRSPDGGQTWGLFDEGITSGMRGGSLVQDPETGTLYLLASFAPGSLWRRERGASKWVNYNVPGEPLVRNGGLHLTKEGILYVGSYGLWRRDTRAGTATEPGPCGPLV